MTWTSGTWADVAIGDDVLGADGYAWRVTTGAINYFGPSGKGESLRVTMERAPIGARTGDVFASKSVKYRLFDTEGDYVRRLVSCVYCLRSYAEDPCKLHAPVSPGVQMLADALGMPVPPRLPVPDAEPTYTVAETCEAWGGCDEHPAPAIVESKPFVEYDDAERAAASALKGAGLQMTVIERQMTLDGLTEHIGNVHGEPLPGAGGNVTRIELRSRLADLHFQLHEHGQPRGQRWEPRGSTAHVHPVMDRPTGDPEPTSFRAKR